MQTIWIVIFDGAYIGPFDSEEACYSFAAKVSRQVNDWTPIRLIRPATAAGMYA